MKAILAVSGGIDSMVMLHIFIHQMNKSENYYSPDDIIVVHFDHGIRENSMLDAEFVYKKAQEYGCEFQLEKANLGPMASEAVAREKRYDFLRKVASEFSENGQPAPIFTAHHLDDLVETITINLLRGTGWRGLAAFDTLGIYRPFLEPTQFPGFQKHSDGWRKQDILRYAGENNIVFREDQTNSSDEYMRNRVRHQMNNYSKINPVYRLWRQQKELKDKINVSVDKLLPLEGESWQRKWFRDLSSDDLDKAVALELLRAGALRANIPATRPQLDNLRQAIMTYQPGKYFNMPNDKLMRIDKDTFSFNCL